MKNCKVVYDISLNCRFAIMKRSFFFATSAWRGCNVSSRRGFIAWDGFRFCK